MTHYAVVFKDCMMSNEALPVVVVRRNVPSTEWVCPHCRDTIREKHVAYDGEHIVHRDCGGKLICPEQPVSPMWQDTTDERTAGRKVKDVVRNRHGYDREEVYDDGDQVLNDNLEESVTTGAIAATMTSFPGSTQATGRAHTQKGNNMTKKHSMAQSGKPLGGKKLTHDKTGEHSTAMHDHGEPFGRKQKNTGGQWEKTGKHEGHMKEHMTPTDIANTLVDDGVTLQQVFNQYATGINYVSLNEFNEVSRAYGCICQDEATFIKLMEDNQDFMFVEGADNCGKFWVPQPISENLANFGGKKGKPFGKKGKKKDEECDETEMDGKHEECDEEEHASKKPWESTNSEPSICEEETAEMRSIVEQVTGRPQGPRSKSGKRRPISEAGFQYGSREDMEDRFRDPNYGSAKDPGLTDFPMFNDDLDDDMAYGDDLVGRHHEAGEDHSDLEGSSLRHGDVQGADNYGSQDCPECGAVTDELGCPECGYTETDIAPSNEMDPSDMAAGREEYDMAGNDSYDHEFGFGENRKRRGQTVLEHDQTVMSGPDGRGLEPHPGKSGGKKSGLPEADSELHDLGKEWPRRHKNTGSAQEAFGHSKSGKATGDEAGGHHDTKMHDHGEPFGRKQKNTGAQWEEVDGSSKMGGGAKKMYEGVSLLAHHVRNTLIEYAKSNNLSSQNGRYPMRFVVSAGEFVKPKLHSQLTEALADAEELVQVFGPESVSFEAQFCRQDGSVAMKRLVPMIRVPQRGPIVQESARGGHLLFRFPEVARDYADMVVKEGKTCRAVTHNWGAAVSARITLDGACKLFNNLKASYRR